MKQPKIYFFTQKNLNLWFFIIPLLSIIIISIGLLIATAWYSVDYHIAAVLAKGLNNEFAKYWSRFYDQLGNTELFIVLMIYITILLETWFLVKINQNNNKFKKNYWLVNSYYFILIFGWIIGNSITISLIPHTDSGFGVGIDFVLLDNIKYKLTGAILAFIYQTTFLILGLYYVRYKLVKTNRIIIEQSWIKAVKGISFLVITYVIIVILKGATYRGYYYNAIFGDLIKEHPEFLSHYLQSGYKYGYDLGQGFINNVPWEFQFPWWKPSILLVHNQNMPTFDLPWHYAFPSGHVNATFCTGAIILLFLKNKDNKTVNWKIKLCFIIWLLHVLSMNFALIVERMHWISDTAFTFIFSSFMIIIVNFSVTKILQKKIK